MQMNWLSLKRGWVIALTLSAQASWAGGLFAPFSLDSASVMPKGVRSVRLMGFSTEIGDRYNGSGYIIPTADSFNKPVTWRELFDATPAGVERGKMKGGMSKFGVSMDDVAGESMGIVNARLTTTVPALAYGLTEKATIAVAVPIMYTNVSVSTGWAVNPSAEKAMNEAAVDFPEKIQQYKPMLQNVVDTKIASYGYKPLENQSRTEIGDIVVGGKYQFWKEMRWAAAIAPKVIVPTGRVADVDRVVDVASGDGLWAVGLGAVVDFSPTSKVTLTSSLNYTYQLPTQKAKRIPLSGTESISPDKDLSVREKRGDITTVGLSGRMKVQELWTLGVGSSFAYKNQDSYKGDVYAPERYRYMEVDTEQTLVAAQAGVSYSTIPLYQRKQFAVPLDATISFSSVLLGRNVAKATLTAFELAAYF